MAGRVLLSESRSAGRAVAGHPGDGWCVGRVVAKTRLAESAWHLTTAKKGMSAVTLACTLGTSYEVAWPTLRRSSSGGAGGAERLSGDVKVDETFVGRRRPRRQRGGGARKGIVVVAVEVTQPKSFGRVRVCHVPDASGATLVPFVSEVTGVLHHGDARASPTRPSTAWATAA